MIIRTRIINPMECCSTSTQVTYPTQPFSVRMYIWCCCSACIVLINDYREYCFLGNGFQLLSFTYSCINGPISSFTRCVVLSGHLMRKFYNIDCIYWFDPSSCAFITSIVLGCIFKSWRSEHCFEAKERWQSLQ